MRHRTLFVQDELSPQNSSKNGYIGNEAEPVLAEIYTGTVVFFTDT
jgi:hypothetical protein